MSEIAVEGLDFSTDTLINQISGPEIVSTRVELQSHAQAQVRVSRRCDLSVLGNGYYLRSENWLADTGHAKSYAKVRDPANDTDG